MTKRIIRQSNGFEAWRQLTLHYAGGHQAQLFALLRTITSPSWDSTTRQFTRQYYKWLEDINRYESENGQGAITNHLQIATIINHLKGPIGQHLMLRVNNTTTFAKVHQWICNFFNSAYSGADTAEDEQGQLEEEQYMIAFNKWKKGKGQWTKGWTQGKGKDKSRRKKGDYTHKDAEKDKGKQPSICCTCGRTGHYSSQCYQNTKGKGNKSQLHQYNSK
eukprot:3110278-Amphidinium_carterae.2